MSITMMVLAAVLAPGCTPLPGADAVMRRTDIRTVMVGEEGHGTNEMPAAAADLICAAITHRRPVTVALEYARRNQRAIDAYLASDGGDRARDALLAAPLWDPDWADGKSSQAMLRLIEWLRIRHRAGQVAQVVAFDVDAAKRGGDRDRQMAERLATVAASPAGIVIALTGSFHARRHDDAQDPAHYTPAAGLLPPTSTFAIVIRGNGGRHWGCRQDGCGPQPVEPTGKSRRRLRLTPGQPDYDAVLDLGVPVTPSPPAKAAATAPSTEA
jgi:hypothetical protein